MRRGAALIVVLVALTIVGVMLAVTAAAFVRTSYVAMDRRARVQLYYAAEAGVERFRRGEGGAFEFAGRAFIVVLPQRDHPAIKRELTFIRGHPLGPIERRVGLGISF